MEGLDDADDDAEDEQENENDLEVTEEAEPVLRKPPEPPVVTKEAERQLSKKELKKKGLEELEAVLAELGYTRKEPTGQEDDSNGNMVLSIIFMYKKVALNMLVGIFCLAIKKFRC